MVIGELGKKQPEMYKKREKVEKIKRMTRMP